MLNNLHCLIPNPEQVLQQMMAQNPQLQAVMTQIKNSGMTPTQFLNQYMQQNNLSQQQMIQALRNIGIKL